MATIPGPASLKKRVEPEISFGSFEYLPLGHSRLPAYLRPK
jgi:hypothetical protein